MTDHKPAPRGTVIATDPATAVLRARQMANHPHTPRHDPLLPDAPEGYYRLKYPNGGTDPTAPDNFARWSKPGSKFVNVTGDCVSLVAWAWRFDRYQEERGDHIQGGAINCDFMVKDARGPQRCFRLEPRPYAGAIVVYPSLPDGDDDGERDGAGHTGIVISTPIEWDPTVRSCWELLGVIDCASRGNALAVQYTTGLTWWGNRRDKGDKVVPKGSIFVTPIMRP